MDRIFEYAVQIGLKPHTVPRYEKIYYGTIYGYAVTLFRFYDGGSLELYIDTAFPSSEDENALKQLILDTDLKEKYHIPLISIKNDFIGISWGGYPDSRDLNDFISFIEDFFPLLEQYHATGATVCTECGGEIKGDSGRWCHMNSSVTKYVHKKCCGTVARKNQRLHSFFPRKKLPTYKAGILGTTLAILPTILIWAYVFRYAEAGVVATSIMIGVLAWFGYTINFGFRGRLKPLIMLGITLLEFGLGTLLLPLFDSIDLLPPGSTDPYILIFISCVFAVFLIMIIWIIEALYYAIERRHGFYGVTTWKNKK